MVWMCVQLICNLFNFKGCISSMRWCNCGIQEVLMLKLSKGIPCELAFVWMHACRCFNYIVNHSYIDSTIAKCSLPYFSPFFLLTGPSSHAFVFSIYMCWLFGSYSSPRSYQDIVNYNQSYSTQCLRVSYMGKANLATWSSRSSSECVSSIKSVCLEPCCLGGQRLDGIGQL